MKQLGVLDSAFINLEMPNTPQHIGGLGIYDQSTAPGGAVRFRDVIANFERRLNSVPLFRTRVVHVPGKIDRPYWVEDPNFDVEFHLRHIALPAPGDWRQLWIQAARLHARPLDMSRPLWEAYIIEGLDNIPDVPKGAFAIYTKMHHALVDGAGGQAFMMALHDLAADVDDAPPIEDTAVSVDRQPGSAELLARAAVNRTKNSLGLIRGTAGVIRDMAGHQLKVIRKEIPPADINAPQTRFNNPVGPHRVAEAAVFQLDDFKTIKNAAGITINDVALSVVGGAMRKYLQHHDELPAESLAAGIPINMRNKREATDENNQVGSMYCAIHTDIEDPLERLKAVHDSANDAKISNEENPLVDALKVAGAFSPALSQTAAELYSNRQLSRFVPANISTVISNVPGPNFPLYSAGAKMVRYHAMGLLTPGCGVFHLVYSCNGLITVTLLADRDIIPDPAFYRECLEASFAETLKATRKTRKPRKKTATRAKKARAA